MAGEIPGLAEPAIVLTPNDEDVPFEGLRTASDVAVMRLDADLVMLSACNTAVPESGPYAEGLSGLARAFLQAGARRLLVSPGGSAVRQRFCRRRPSSRRGRDIAMRDQPLISRKRCGAL